MVQHFGPGFLGPLLALSGGALVYLGAAHLLPVTLKKQSVVTMVCLGIGVLLALLVLQAKH